MACNENIIITAMGAITPLGCTSLEIAEALTNKRSCIKEISTFDCSELKTKKAAEIIDFEASKYLGSKGIRLLDRGTRLLLSALIALKQEKSQKDTNNQNEVYSDDRVGLVVGSTLSIIKSMSDFDKESQTEPQYINPMKFPNTVLNAPLGYAGIANQTKALNVTVGNGGTSSLDAIGIAIGYLRNGFADCIYAGGVSVLSEPLIIGLDKSNITGFRFVAEGSAVFSLEKKENAKAQNKHILGEIIAYDTLYCENIEKGLTKCIQYTKDSTVNLSQITHVVPSPNIVLSQIQKKIFSKDMHPIFVENVNNLIGDAMSAHGAIQLAGVLSDPEIPAGANILFSAIGCEGNISQLIVQKCG